MDCRRTDRTQPLFASTTPTIDAADDEKGMHMRYSTISPGLSDIGAQAPSNEHIERLGSVLLTYNFYDTDLGMMQHPTDDFQLLKYWYQVMYKACLTSVHLCTSSWMPMRN